MGGKGAKGRYAVGKRMAYLSCGGSDGDRSAGGARAHTHTHLHTSHGAPGTRSYAACSGGPARGTSMPVLAVCACVCVCVHVRYALLTHHAGRGAARRGWDATICRRWSGHRGCWLARADL